jgi:NIMA (never in mitosis gene a)-related kinase 1/4/5
MLKGLKIHNDQKILLRDLKYVNIFLTKERQVKLRDLNVSKVGKKGLLYAQTGIPYYESLEIWEDKLYDKKSDI